MFNRFLLVVSVVLLAAACGGDESADPTTTTDSGPSATTTTALVTTTTVAATTTTTEPGVTYASLDAAQQENLDRICGNVADPGANLVGEITVLEVLTGAVGVPALEEAWSDLGQGAEKSELLEAAAPICSDLDWSPPPSTTTTTVFEAAAAVEVVIGDLELTGETPGCPPTEILAGEYWVGPRSTPFTDADGAEWRADLSVDATGEGLGLEWSFSFTDGRHRLISYHLNQSTFSSNLGPELAVFDTIFDDSLASISGGFPDTAGTITIACG